VPAILAASGSVALAQAAPAGKAKPDYFHSPQSYGILQNRYPYEDGGWPAMISSTAMNADAAYGIWRACFGGCETWLNTVPRGNQYHAGDAWGCVGRWFAGRWRTSAALGYVAKVKKYLKEKIWLKPYFRQLG
jgi:hypothetical protein